MCIRDRNNSLVLYICSDHGHANKVRARYFNMLFGGKEHNFSKINITVTSTDDVTFELLDIEYIAILIPPHLSNEINKIKAHLENVVYKAAGTPKTVEIEDEKTP